MGPNKAALGKFSRRCCKCLKYYHTTLMKIITMCSYFFKIIFVFYAFFIYSLYLFYTIIIVHYKQYTAVSITCLVTFASEFNFYEVCHIFLEFTL